MMQLHRAMVSNVPSKSSRLFSSRISDISDMFTAQFKGAKEFVKGTLLSTLA
jgi:hypothetical protein